MWHLASHTTLSVPFCSSTRGVCLLVAGGDPGLGEWMPTTEADLAWSLLYVSKACPVLCLAALCFLGDSDIVGRSAWTSAPGDRQQGHLPDNRDAGKVTEPRMQGLWFLVCFHHYL